MIEKQAAGYHVLGDPRPAVTLFVSQRKISEGTFVSLAALVKEISAQVDQYGSIAKIRRHDYYGSFERVERGVYALSPAGRRGLESFTPPDGRSRLRRC